MKEELSNIGLAIEKHRKDEIHSYKRIPAIGRVFCNVEVVVD